MLKEFLDRLLEIRDLKTFEIDGKTFSNQRMFLIEPRKISLEEPRVIECNTLTGIKDYLDSNVDGLNFKELIAFVENNKSVSIQTALKGDLLQRLDYIQAIAYVNRFSFGHYYDVEDFIIQLQTNFVPNDDLFRILKVVGNLKEENSTGTKDDGITQKVVTKKGVSLGNNEDLPNPVKLRPYRTFLEIEQPESLFVLRMKDGPKCALFEADGGRWINDSMAEIKDWLQNNIPEEITIIA